MEPSIEQLRQERRSRREKRRAEQRTQNPIRALKMRQARLLGEVRLPKSLHRLNRRLYVGCSGWYYWHWRDCFYPPNIPGGKWFDYYASHFHTVELNAPFYSWPTVAAVAGWIRQAGRRQMVYTVKVNELITHQKRFVGCKALVRDFGHIADLLGKRMGCFLFQFPPSFHYSPSALRRIANFLDPSRRNVVEFRHKSWWNQTVYDAFREHNIIFCSSSSPRLPDELIKTADEIYVRFNGKSLWYRHDYSKAELQIWAKRILKSGAKRAWVYFNNDRDCYSIKNARMLMRLLNRRAA